MAFNPILPTAAPQLGREYSVSYGIVNAEIVDVHALQRSQQSLNLCHSFSTEQWNALEEAVRSEILLRITRSQLGDYQTQALKEFLGIEAEPKLFTRASVEYKAQFRFEEVILPGKNEGKPVALFLHVTYSFYIQMVPDTHTHYERFT